MSVMTFEKNGVSIIWKIFGYLSFAIFWIFLSISCLVPEKKDHNPFLVSFNLSNNSFIFKQLFRDIVTTVTTKFDNMFGIF